MQWPQEPKTVDTKLKHNKALLHWASVALLIPIGIWLGDWFKEQGYWIEKRYEIYQWLQEQAPRPARSKRTVLVLIGDEEYWKGSLARRVPINRDYLATVLKKLSETGHPKVIALDFDLSSPTPDGTLNEHPAYSGETERLLQAIEKVSSTRTTVVLPLTLGQNEQGYYYVRSAIFDRPERNGVKFGDNVQEGYINLHDDIRLTPLLLKLQKGGAREKVVSFAGAIARAVDENALKRFEGKDSIPYARYIEPRGFPQLSADFIYRTEPERLKADPKLRQRDIVIIGGDWHRFAYGTGPKIDTYLTPVGWMGGVFIHANYVESLLDDRTLGAWGKKTEVGIEIVASLFIAFILHPPLPKRLKLSVLEHTPLSLLKRWPRMQSIVFVLLKILLSVLLLIGLLIFSYVSMHLWGIYFDFFIPYVLLSGHVACEKIFGWYVDAYKYRLQEA